jgi:hypothetical protein
MSSFGKKKMMGSLGIRKTFAFAGDGGKIRLYLGKWDV